MIFLFYLFLSLVAELTQRINILTKHCEEKTKVINDNNWQLINAN